MKMDIQHSKSRKTEQTYVNKYTVNDIIQRHQRTGNVQCCARPLRLQITSLADGRHIFSLELLNKSSQTLCSRETTPAPRKQTETIATAYLELDQGDSFCVVFNNRKNASQNRICSFNYEVFLLTRKSFRICLGLPLFCQNRNTLKN